VLTGATLVDGSHADQPEEAELVVVDELEDQSAQVEALEVVLNRIVSLCSLKLEHSHWRKGRASVTSSLKSVRMSWEFYDVEAMPIVATCVAERRTYVVVAGSHSPQVEEAEVVLIGVLAFAYFAQPQHSRSRRRRVPVSPGRASGGIASMVTSMLVRMASSHSAGQASNNCNSLHLFSSALILLLR
jgi:hypothetical protein